MDLNPYDAPQESACELPATPDHETFSPLRLLAITAGLMGLVLAAGVVVRMISF